MKKQFLAIAALAMTSAAYGQVGINNTAPTATLDITAKTPAGTTSSTNEGLLIPRVTRERVNSITSPVTSTMIYVNDVSTGAASGASVNIDAVGFYYYNGVAWVKMGAAAAAALTANNGLTLTSGNLQLGGALTQPTTISGLTATNKLAITGTGANAFSVDGSTLSVDAANHYIGMGTATPDARLTIAGTGLSDDDFNFYSNGNNGNTGGIVFNKSRGTNAAPTAIANNDYIGDVFFRGYDGSAYTPTARISAVVNGTVAAGTIPSDLLFGTGAGSAERMRITSTGNVGVATFAPAATLDVAAKAATGTTTGVDGILIPRVTRERAGSMSSVPVSTLVYISEVATGAQSGPTANVDAAGFYYSDGSVWQKLGGSPAATPYQNIRGGVAIVTTGSYTIQPADYTVITKASSTVTITFPNLSAADAGRTVWIYNQNSVTGNNPLVNITTGTVNNGGQLRGFVAIWTGTEWIMPNK